MGQGVLRGQRAWADDLGAEIGAADLRRASAVLDRVVAALPRRRRHGLAAEKVRI